jgi:hypothetical protein
VLGSSKSNLDLSVVIVSFKPNHPVVILCELEGCMCGRQPSLKYRPACRRKMDFEPRYEPKKGKFGTTLKWMELPSNIEICLS